MHVSGVPVQSGLFVVRLLAIDAGEGGIYLDDSAMKAVRRGTKLPRAQ